MRIESPLFFYPANSDFTSDKLSSTALYPQSSSYQELKFTGVDSGWAVNNSFDLFRPPKPFTGACAIRVSDMPEEAASDLRFLIGYLKEEDPCLRWFAASRLGSIGASSKDVQDPLIEVAEDNEEFLFVRLAAVDTLGAVRSAVAIPVLMKILMDDTQNIHLVLSAMDALGNIGCPAEGAVPEVMYLKPNTD